MGEGRPRMLAVVARFKYGHIDYLRALGEHFDLRGAWSGRGHALAVDDAESQGIRLESIGTIKDDGVAEVRSRLAAIVAGWKPDLVHVMYYRHEALALTAREVIGDSVPLLFECRDPLTTSGSGPRGSEAWDLERDAIQASDAQVLVSPALRSYFERVHGLDLRDSSLLVPHAFARRNLGPPARKLSAADGRLHIALVGTVDDRQGQGRWYGEIIRSLVSEGAVVHSHFHDLEGISLQPYRALAAELEDYHHHPKIPFRKGTLLSETISRYDLMGVFHELDAPHHNESATLAVCMPTKAVCGWVHGGIPAVCFPHYRGLVDPIEEHGIGFVISGWEEIGGIAEDRAAIARATERCLAERDRFTHEHNAERIRDLVDRLLARRRPAAAVS